MNIDQTKKALKIARELGVTLNLIGPHGIGKSSVVKQYAAEEGLHYHEFRTGQAADAGDLTGLPEFQVHELGHKFTDFILPAWFPRQENSVVFFDEVNRGAKDILNGVFEAILDLSMKGIKMPKGTQIVAAMNPPNEDYSGTVDFDDKAFQDRFVHVNFKPTFQEFYSYANGKYPTSGFLAYLQEDTKMLQHGDLQAVDLSFVIPSPRSWETALKLEKIYDKGNCDKALFMELMMGIVGLTATTAAVTFKETHVGSIRGSDLIENYHTGEIRSRLLAASKKNRTDIIGNAIQEIKEEFEKRKGLSNQEGLNVIAVVADLNAEQAYTLCTIIASAHECCSNVEGMPGDSEGAGLLGSDELVALMQKTLKAREKAMKAAEKRKKKEEVVEESEEVSF